ncbi:MAG TPA: Crp/Fnr family transcriptional regulator [Devosia sp.]|nr:Crp/Fnr family transcriptional regulator [Devosia sp.]
MNNKLLRILPPDEFSTVAQHLEALPLPREFSVAGAGEPIEYVYFFETGICSIVAKSPEGQQVEAGIFGRESFGPPAIAAGVQSTPLDIYVQVAGSGHRIAGDVFMHLLESCPRLSELVQISAYLMALQTAFTSLSNAAHQVDERLARWLLMCHDRTDGDEIALTHEFIAMMLAVRRPSVTTALHSLEGSRYIRAERGHITIRSREGLEDFAADAYGVPEAEFAKLIGPLR